MAVYITPRLFNHLRSFKVRFEPVNPWMMYTGAEDRLVREPVLPTQGVLEQISLGDPSLWFSAYTGATDALQRESEIPETSLYTTSVAVADVPWWAYSGSTDALVRESDIPENSLYSASASVSDVPWWSYTGAADVLRRESDIPTTALDNS